MLFLIGDGEYDVMFLSKPKMLRHISVMNLIENSDGWFVMLVMRIRHISAKSVADWGVFL